MVWLSIFSISVFTVANVQFVRLTMPCVQVKKSHLYFYHDFHPESTQNFGSLLRWLFSDILITCVQLAQRKKMFVPNVVNPHRSQSGSKSIGISRFCSKNSTVGSWKQNINMFKFRYLENVLSQLLLLAITSFKFLSETIYIGKYL